MKKTMTILALACAIAVLQVACAVSFPSGTDMVTLHDYAYYVQNPQKERADHSPAEGGVFTLSADRIWSRISLGAATAGDSLLFDLGGHGLTLTGCDVTSKPIYFNQANTTTIISNGTFATVYDPSTYTWTIDHPEWYQNRRGCLFGGDGSELIIENDGKLAIETGSSVNLSGNGNRLVVRKGGNLDSKISFSGTDNRIVFEEGSAFGRMSSYVSGGTFPQSVWMESGYVSNVVEVCDSDLLSRSHVVNLSADMNNKKGSFRCGLVLSGAGFDYTVDKLFCGSLNAPVLFQVLRGAKLTMRNEPDYGMVAAASGTRVTIDGEGSTLCNLNGWSRIGGGVNCTDTVVRVSNGACFSNAGKLTIGYSAGADGNGLELLSGAHYCGGGSLLVGTGANEGSFLIVDGANTTATNAEFFVGYGGEAPCEGGRHVVRVSNGATLSCAAVRIGESCAGCALTVSDDANFVCAGELRLGGAGAGERNSLSVLNGATIANAQNVFLVYGNDCNVVVSNGTFVSKQMFFSFTDTASNACLTVAGESPLVKSTDWGLRFSRGAKIKFVVPRNGYASVPLEGHNYVDIDESCTLEIDATDFLGSDNDVVNTPLIYSEAGLQIDSNVLANARVTEGCVLRTSADNKTLFLRRKNRGMAFVVR